MWGKPLVVASKIKRQNEQYGVMTPAVEVGGSVFFFLITAFSELLSRLKIFLDVLMSASLLSSLMLKRSSRGPTEMRGS